MSRYGGQAVFGAELQVRSAPFRETGGATEGFALSRQWKEGSSGAAYFDGAWTYSTGTLTVGDDGVARPVVASRTEYTEAINSGSSGANTTSYSTRFYSRELAVEKVTTTHPTVSTSNNGSCTAATESVYLDRAGRRSFSKSASGIIAYTEYADGLATKRIQGADTTLNSVGEDFYGVAIPTGLSGSGTPLHRVTEIAYDAQRRCTESPRGISTPGATTGVF